MKSLLAITIATTLLAVSGIAQARENSQRTLSSIMVQQHAERDCTPPTTDKTCSPLHAQIRHVFSKREIGMLFGARTAFPESRAGYDRVHERYAVFQRDLGLYGARSVALVIQ